MAADERMQLKPAKGEMVAERLMVPVKPLLLFKPTVALPEAAARIVKLAGLMFRAKSGDAVATKTTVVAWLKTPLVAVMVIPYVAGNVVELVMIVRFEEVEPDADNVPSDGFSEELRPG